MKILHIVSITIIIIGLILLISNFSSIVEIAKITPEPDTPTPTIQFGSGPGDESSLSLASVVSCTPDSGYDFCYENTYGSANAKIMSTTWQGEQRYVYVNGAKRWVYIDEVYVNVKYKGDKLYKSSSSSWINCGSNGCSATSISPGKVIIATAPASSIGPIQFAAWDKFTSTSGQYWYSYVNFGWLSSTPYYVIDCYDDSDCQDGYYCDKSGSWDTWTEKIDPCSTMPDPENICDGFDYWSQKCVNGEYVKDELIESNSINCGCYVQETPNICDGYELWSQKQTTQCVEGLIKDQLIEERSTQCGYICTDGETKSYPCTDGTEIITQRCIDNTWTEVEPEACPFNWTNLESILRGYVEDMINFMKWNN